MFARRNDESQLAAVYGEPMNQLREYAHPYPLHLTHAEMHNALYYDVSTVQLPGRASNWVCVVYELSGYSSVHDID